MIKLFIGGFPLEISEMDIVQMVARYVDVSTIKIVRDKKTKICKGYAFLEVTTREGAKEAIAALNGTKLSGRELKLSIVEDPDAPVKVVFKPMRPRIKRH